MAKPRSHAHLLFIRPTIGAATVTALWLLVGCFGFMLTDGFSAADAFHQSAMLASGMGPIKPVATLPGMLWDSFYAIASGLVMLGAAGILFAPAIHYALRRAKFERSR